MNDNKAGFAKPAPLSHKIHIDFPLLAGILTLFCISLVVIYSAGGESVAMVKRQAINMGASITAMVIAAQFPPTFLRRWAIPLFLVGVGLLVATLLFGHVGKGAQRWIDFGVAKFQPSEAMKLILPIMIAHYITRYALPVNIKHALIAAFLIAVPVFLIYKQPDLGTSILVASSGVFALFLAGMSWRVIGSLGIAAVPFGFMMWTFFLHDYQKRRVLTFLNPETDPLGNGYHIIQSKIAIGSGGLEGKGWLNGTQSQLEFLPERHTDFIFSVFSEEFGLYGVAGLLCVYLFIIARCLFIANNAQEPFSKILAGAITLTFFVYLFVNIGMVSGLLPVVGVPLPLVSWGGTSMITLMSGFGIIMAIHTHRKFNR
ncbi:MAG: rod shape-determining protein RodA [Psychrobium sp.]